VLRGGHGPDATVGPGVGYESLSPGVGLISARTRRRRRPRLFAALEPVPIHRRKAGLAARR
jgi:hypothetical protein